MTDQNLNSTFLRFYTDWVSAISRKDWDWFERHVADDFTGTARPWPGFGLTKGQFIELDKQIEEIDGEWQRVEAVKVGEHVHTVAVLLMKEERFRQDSVITDPSFSSEHFQTLISGNEVRGKVICYTGIWRHDGTVWQVMDHRMIFEVASWD